MCRKKEAYWNEFAKNWKQKMEKKIFEMYMPIYEKHLTLEELKAVAAFYESPVGEKYKEASLIVMREGKAVVSAATPDRDVQRSNAGEK